MSSSVFSFRALIPLVILLLIVGASNVVTGFEPGELVSSPLVHADHSLVNGTGGVISSGIPLPGYPASGNPLSRTMIPDIIDRRTVAAQPLVPTQTMTPTPTPTLSLSENMTRTPLAHSYVPDRVIVKYKTGNISMQGTVSQTASQANAAVGAIMIADESVLGVKGMQLVRLTSGRSVQDAIATYQKNPAVEFAQPDYIYNISDQPQLKVSVPLNTDATSYRENLLEAIQQVGSRKPAVNPVQLLVSGSNGSVPEVPQGTDTLGIMRISPEEKQLIYSQVKQSVHVADASAPIAQGSANLLPYLQYTPSERNQGSCGNCWVWASTGAVEIAQGVQTGVKDRFSIQYFNSNYNGGTGTRFACNGGWTSSFTNFYSNAPYKQLVPWSNAGADYADGTCGSCTTTKRPASQITGTPNYPLTSMSVSVVRTADVSQTQAIANIKSQLNANKPIWWAFFLPDSMAWSNFYSFWGTKGETALWNPDPYNDIDYTSSGGGHAVLIVGYDDTSTNPDEWYWIVLNSWGTNSQRPHGLFRLKMMMDYQGVDTDGYDNHYFEILNVKFADTVQTGQISVTSTPGGATIYLNDIQQDSVTPATLSTVSAGSHTLKLVKSGYKEYSQSVTVTGGQTSTVTATMTTASSGTVTNPNDPAYSLLWGLHNTGQSGGTIDADIDAPEAWAVTTGSSSVVVGVVDTGVDYTHPDLAANCVGGYNAITKTTNPMDDNGHGTHCAGTIAAVGNNGIGVIGVAPSTRIMPLKFLGSSGSGYTTDALDAIRWGYQRGVRIFSNSWGGYGTDSAMQSAFNTYSDAIFICAAGNDAVNTDVYPHSPAALPNANILAVAATNKWDNLAWFSNYGANTVDVAAPGQDTYSTIPGSYGYKSGTSMATPHVAGVAALVKAVSPGYTVAQVKEAIMSKVDTKSSLSGKCVTGGRVNAESAVSIRIRGTGSRIGTYYTSNGLWTNDYNGNGEWDGPYIDDYFWFGTSGVTPVVGDWNNDGKDEVGNYYSNGLWAVDWNGNNAWDGPDIDRLFWFGTSGVTPVVGDWNNDGKDEVGNYYSNGLWAVDWNGNNAWDGPDIDRLFWFGSIGDIPIVGDWNHDGKDEVGNYKGDGLWAIDLNGNNAWDGTFIDRTFNFGTLSTLPVVGNW